MLWVIALNIMSIHWRSIKLQFATKHIVKLRIESEDREFDLAILQFLIDFLGKNYEITDEDLEEIVESNDAFSQLIEDIYESVSGH